MDPLFIAALALIVTGGVLLFTRFALTADALLVIGTAEAVVYSLTEGWAIWVTALFFAAETYHFTYFCKEAVNRWRSRREEVAS